MSSRLTVVLVSQLQATPAVIFCLGILVLQATMVVLCPEECRCGLGGYNVFCSGLSLSNIPLIFPTNVSSLVLYNNNIKSLEKDRFISRGLTELAHLSVQRSRLEGIELGAFNGLTKLTYLDMSFNQISEIIPRTFAKMSLLKHLNLAYNRLQYLEFDVFVGLDNVGSINMQRNELQYVHPDLFVGLPNLEVLHLTFNPDLKIPTDSQFISSNSLAFLDIGYCNVRSVSHKTFANVSALELLDLHYNNLSSVDINILKVLPKLSILYLKGNRLQCDCQLQEVWRWCQDHNIQTADGECDTPSEVKGMWWGVLEEGQCLQGNIYYYGDYENTSYSYTPSENTDPDIDLWKYSYRVSLAVYAVPFIFGTTGNAILLIIIICNKDMRTVPNMYILNLAITDMIYLMLHFVMSCATIISCEWLKSDISCIFVPFVNRLSIGLSAYSVAVLSIQRYRVTVYPFHVRVSSQPTWRVTAATICGVWIVAALFALPSAVSGYFCADLVTKRNTYYENIVVFELLVSCVLPLCVIAFSYIMTARHLVKSAQPISDVTQNPQLNTRKNTAKIVVGLTVVFLISYVPDHVLWTCIVFNIFSLSDIQFGGILDYTELVSTYLLSLNPCLNPVALLCTSLAFRTQFKRYLTCCCKTNPTASNIELTIRN